MTSTLLKTSPLHTPQIHRLPNGLTVIAEQMPVEAVNLNLWVNIGSAVESDDINGMAHFLEHIVFKGTNKLASGEFEQRIEEKGAVTNAATSQDYTHFYITTAPKDFAELAPLQIDVVCNPSIPQDAFEKERLVVLEEIRRSEDNPRRRISRHTIQTAFDLLPYRRPVLGSHEIISQVTPQQMREFHQNWYQPSSMTAVAVGNLPVEELIEIVAQGFAQNTQPSQFLSSQNEPLKVNQETPFTEIVRQQFVDESLQQARLIILWRVPGMMDLQNTYALDVVAGILGHGRTSRLVNDLREEKGLVSSISVSNTNYKLQGIFSISAKCDPENVEIVEKAIIEHLGKIHTELVQTSEIARVRTRVANRFIFGNETPSNRSSLYGYYQSIIGELEPAFNYPQHIQSQTEHDLMVAAQKYLPTNAYGVVVIKPN
ncbi:MAG: insulinase family protein [Sphaerospermopsis sp. SIO1G2]|nr:insulinase family protein [Sphaerospermopsis sp. SIO1G2]